MGCAVSPAGRWRVTRQVALRIRTPNSGADRTILQIVPFRRASLLPLKAPLEAPLRVNLGTRRPETPRGAMARKASQPPSFRLPLQTFAVEENWRLEVKALFGLDRFICSGLVQPEPHLKKAGGLEPDQT